jgi:inner membrane protein involved in colicin E2 resistance
VWSCQRLEPKSVLLFVGLVFLTYFVFEVTTRKRVHPAQHVLVGVAQMIFYLLLLSMSERIGFDWGFLTAGGVLSFCFRPTRAGFSKAECRAFAL